MLEFLTFAAQPTSPLEVACQHSRQTLEWFVLYLQGLGRLSKQSKLLRMGDYGIDFMGDTLMFITEVPKLLREGGWHLLLFASSYLSQEEASPASACFHELHWVFFSIS